MSELTQIKDTTGTVYDLVDSGARTLIEAINNWDYVVCTSAANTPYGVQWDNGGTTITGTLVAASTTMYKIYLVPDSNDTNDIYDEYITVNPSGSTYKWELFGHTRLPDMTQYMKNKSGHSGGTAGDLAYKDSASGSFTPSGSVAAPTISVATAGSTDTIKNPTAKTVVTDMDVATPSSTQVSGEMNYAYVSGTMLILNKIVETRGDSITTENKTVKTGDATYSATAPAFTGAAGTVNVS